MNNYSKEELLKMVKAVGDNVRIHKTVQFFQSSQITIGSNVRIDAFSILSGRVQLGNNIHIAAGCYMYGSHQITMHDFSGISGRVSLYTTSDDFLSGHLTGPTIPEEFTKIISGPITLQKHVIVGCGSVILPNVTCEEGASIGALSVVSKNVPAFTLVAGTPAKTIKKRNMQKIKELEKDFKDKYGDYISQ
jgi:galactoside O-acetyltransferase